LVNKESQPKNSDSIPNAPRSEHTAVLDIPQRIQQTESSRSASLEEDKAIHKLVLAGLPKTNEWLTFSGVGEYDHFKFIDWIDNLK
jgi:hypothetical protein